MEPLWFVGLTIKEHLEGLRFGFGKTGLTTKQRVGHLVFLLPDEFQLPGHFRDGLVWIQEPNRSSTRSKQAGKGGVVLS